MAYGRTRGRRRRLPPRRRYPNYGRRRISARRSYGRYRGSFRTARLGPTIFRRGVRNAYRSPRAVRSYLPALAVGAGALGLGVAARYAFRNPFRSARLNRLTRIARRDPFRGVASDAHGHDHIL